MNCTKWNKETCHILLGPFIKNNILKYWLITSLRLDCCTHMLLAFFSCFSLHVSLLVYVLSWLYTSEMVFKIKFYYGLVLSSCCVYIRLSICPATSRPLCLSLDSRTACPYSYLSYSADSFTELLGKYWPWLIRHSLQWWDLETFTPYLCMHAQIC